MRRFEALAVIAGAAIAGVAPVAVALDYQVHGSLAQGFVLSEGNNFYGTSTDGSFEFYEVVLDGTVRPLPKLLLSAEVGARDAGATDDGKPRLDYAFADYAFLKHNANGAGLRAGRVKNYYGLFNATRDVAFTRPGILVPSSVYFESQGARALLFSSDGLQPYGALAVDDHYVSLVGTYAPDHPMSGSQEDRFAGSLGSRGEVGVRNFYVARVLDDWGAGRWTAGLSYLHGKLGFDPNPGVPTDFDFTFQLYAASARYSGEHFDLLGEYGLNRLRGTRTQAGVTAPFDRDGDGGYVQGDWFFDSAWTMTARWDSSFADRHDRNGTRPGSACATNTSTFVTDPHNCYAHDFMVGSSWKSPTHWGAWGEYHLIDGLYTASARDNAPPAPEDARWSLFLLMCAYRF